MLWDLFSISLILYSILIPIYILLYHKSVFVNLLLGMLVIHVLIKSLHNYNQLPFMKRPDDASNCNMCNGGGDYTQRGGFPSGHVTMTTYLWVSLWLNTQNDCIGIIAILVILSMCLSRYYKRCHTILQIVVGVNLGFLLAHIIHT